VFLPSFRRLAARAGAADRVPATGCRWPALARDIDKAELLRVATAVYQQLNP